MSPAPPPRAETLDRFYQTLEVQPLLDAESLQAFYCKELNAVRGEDNVPRLQLELTRSFGGRYFRAFLAGHSGCGKSTELTRLSQAVEEKFRVIRFSAKDEMHPSSAKPFDVLILMMARLGELIAKPDAEGGLAWEPPPDIVRRVRDWFAVETTRESAGTGTTASAEAGAGMGGGSMWAELLGLFFKLKGEIRYASERKTELVERRVARLPELIEAVNLFFDVCNDELKRRREQEWLFLGEDFEKLLDSTLPKTFFVQESAVFSSLRTHMIFTIPVDLAWAANRVDLPFPVYSIQDTPVYTATYDPDKGRAVLRQLLERRINLSLFEDGQLERLLVASGGHLRDLFHLIREAADLALLAEPPAGRIQAEHVSRAINKLRQDVLLRLGESPYDPEPIPWETRAARLKAIYERDPNAAVPDATLHALLRTRAVQEFNGKGRFAVAPLVVDILEKQGKLGPDSMGGLLPPDGAGK